ncbi:MAG: ankyrin repeat domain-containing protein [Armatimonadetes bacterium]|nr:ankyrin repeat domain-containing protein [Armatimonadota bacterium]
MGRRWWAVVCLSVIAVGCGPKRESPPPATAATQPKTPSGELETIPGKDQKLVEIFDQRGEGIGNGAQRGMIFRAFSFAFINNSKREIAEISVKLETREWPSGKLVYACKPGTAKMFSNLAIPYHGSILPNLISTYSIPIRFDLPVGAWRADTYDSFTITEVKVFKDGQDLHDFGHLYTKLANSTSKEAVALFQSDPTLCTAASTNNLTATHAAFATSGEEVITYVLKHGGSIRDRTKTGGTVLDYAPLSPDTTSLDVAVQNGGPNYINPVGQTPLQKAVMARNYDAAKWLLDHGTKPDHEDQRGDTAATMAITGGRWDILDLLVSKGADPLRVNVSGYGWMHYAVWNYGMLPYVAKYLVPVDQTHPPTNLTTPLIFAAQNGRNEVVQWLVAHGANPNAKDVGGKTGADYSKRANTLGTDSFFWDAVKRGRKEASKAKTAKV